MTVTWACPGRGLSLTDMTAVPPGHPRPERGGRWVDPEPTVIADTTPDTKEAP